MFRFTLLCAALLGLPAGYYATSAFLQRQEAQSRSPPRSVLYAPSTRNREKAFLKSGWSGVEDWGVWSVGSRSEVEVSVPAARSDVEFELLASPFTNADRVPTQVVAVEVNGTAVTELTYPNREGAQAIRRFTVPNAVIRRREPVRIAFLVRFPTAPFDIGAGDDRRQLGLGLIHLLVQYYDKDD
ncbi:MAG: hypothetical protein NW223_11030 [Hyphomicrobiaceae bacterium]|nr:hypothetical protein [Hyphomicrobiaceae bacterium]